MAKLRRRIDLTGWSLKWLEAENIGRVQKKSRRDSIYRKLLSVFVETMNVRGPLQRHIASTKLPIGLRQIVINRIFGLDLSASAFGDRDNGLRAYFNDWFEEQCEAAVGEVSVETLEELLEFVAYLQSTNGSQGKICSKLSSISGNLDPASNASLTLAARIWLSISVGSLSHYVTPGQDYNIWENNWEHGKLSKAIHDTLWPKLQTSEKVKLPKVFTAANLEIIGGIRVQWTSNLADHLSLRDDDTKVMLFHQASFLELHKESKKFVLPPIEDQCFNIVSSSILRPDLIEETILTLRLLIPTNDPRSRHWFKKKQRKLGLDSKAGSYGSLGTSARQIEKFHYWRDRLVVLKQTFDESEPQTLRSWWYDDRKKVQWYTFWIALLVLALTIAFGLIQSISGIVQAWASVKSLQT